MHAETIKKVPSCRRPQGPLLPSPCPQVSAFDQTPPPLCGRPLWTLANVGGSTTSDTIKHIRASPKPGTHYV